MIGAPIVQLLADLPGPDSSIDNESAENGLEKIRAIKSALYVMKAPEIKRQLNKVPEKLAILLNYITSTESSP